MKLFIIAIALTTTWICCAMRHNPITQPPVRLYMEDKLPIMNQQRESEENSYCITSALKNVYKRLCANGQKYRVTCMPSKKIKAE